MTTIFETVREQIALPDAAQLYGISSRNGNVRCIFHADNNPSMKLYTDHFHCFGCGAHGDVTDFTAQIYGLSKIEAARKLCSDFGLSEEPYISAPKKCRRLMTERERIQLALDVLTDYLVMLKDFRAVYAPLDESESLDPRFVESLQ
ncbi:MAG: DNA primase, partial [Ruminiclostridium sp.]|nr:DNA primase [Ruminiclostridium sp.]